LRSRSGSGGEHIIFEYIAGVGSSVKKLGAGLDIRSDGGLIIAPPSLHVTGARYAWLNLGTPIAAAPAWLAAMLVTSRPNIDLVGERGETTEISDYGRAALMSAAKNILNAPIGQQQATLNREGYTIGQAAAAGIVPAQDALEVLLLAAKELPNLDPRRPWRAGDAERVVRRAFHQGWGKPRPSIEQLEAEWRRAAEAASFDFVCPKPDAL
jgi:hypothetical protein